MFTRYGNIWRGDLTAIGIGCITAKATRPFYTFGLADPTDAKFRDRSQRFAAMYIGEDPEAPNWDPERKQMRAS